MMNQAWAFATTLLISSTVAYGQCDDQEIRNDSADDGGAVLVCPCFVPDEIPMTIFDTPNASSATLSEVQILWASLIGGPNNSTESAIIVYSMNQDGPVDSATFTEIFRFENPQLRKGVLNVYDFRAANIDLPPERFGVGLEIANDQSGFGGLFSPSVCSDLDGHNNGANTIRNWVFVVPDGWRTAQSLGVTGDWIIRTVVEACDPGLNLGDLRPGIADEVNSITATAVTPGEVVTFVYGRQAGETPVPGCPGVSVAIQSPTIAGSAIGDIEGEATLTAFVPAIASGLTIRIQAVEAGSCRISNVVVHSFP